MMEDLNPLEEVIRVLEAYKRGGIRDSGARESIDGFNQALRIVRTMATVYFTNDQADRLLAAFKEYANTLPQCRTYSVLTCTACSGSHGDTLMIPCHSEGESTKYYYICDGLIKPAYHFVDD